MKVLTEVDLRSELKSGMTDKYSVARDVIITPSARQYLKENNIQLVIVEKDITKDSSSHYISSYTGAAMKEKPEHMTHLYGNKLVYKDDSKIVFRGKLDSLQAEILELQVLTHTRGAVKLTNELEEVLGYCRQMLKAEVLNEAFNIVTIIGLNQEQLREMSHHVKDHFGMQHILPNYQMGEILTRLNTLRTKARETEIAAVEAFREKDEVKRLDIIKALNRLSSCIYVMMCRYKSGLYNE
ncbi:MAG: cobalamin adenosyltransferase [Pseudomonadota bacterium]